MDSSAGAASDLIIAARARKLLVAAQLLEQPAVRSALAEMAPVDAALDPPRSKQLAPLLQLLTRRGIDPDALAWVMPHFETSPVFRSILAWDVLTGSVLVEDAGLDLFRELAADAARLLGPAGKRGVGPALARDLVPRLIDTAASTGELLDRARSGDLGAHVELRARGPEFAAQARALLGDARTRARMFARAHFASLASVQLGVLWHVFEDRDALLDLVEVLLDVENIDDVPSFSRLDPDDVAYVEYRIALARQDAPAAMDAARRLRNSATLRSTAVRVDVASRTRRRNEEAERALEDMLAADPDCRFAARVGVIARLLAGADPTSTVDTFLARFGNDLAVWIDLAAVVERIPEVASAAQRIIARELYFLPHEPLAWRALSRMLPDPLATALRDDVAARLVSQSTFA